MLSSCDPDSVLRNNVESTIGGNVAAVEWDPKWNTGVHLVDTQHRELVELLNRLMSMIDSKVADVEAKRALTMLADYVEFHFDAEEVLMEKTGYPDLPNHRQLHLEMRARVRSYLRHYWTQPQSIPEDVKHFLVSWLSEHLSVVDQEMAAYVRSVKTKAAPDGAAF